MECRKQMSSRNDWDSVNDDLVATSSFEGETFLHDNKRVFDILKPFISIEAPGWSVVEPFNRKCDGRGAAFKVLKSQAEGRCVIATRNAKAYAMVTTAIFTTGKGKFSFNQYVLGKNQQAQNELLFLEEPVAETKRATSDFLARICNPKLEAAIQTCMGNEQKLTNFELCQQYFK